MAVTLKTDRRGLAIIDRARINKDWSALALSWCEAANVSLSTLKRFRERKAIQKDSFIAICRAVGVEDWQRIVATTEENISVLRRKYQQSKRVIAEEVLSNLNSLDARLDFVEQAFSDDPAEAQRQVERINQMSLLDQDHSRIHHPVACHQSDPGKQPELGKMPSEVYLDCAEQTESYSRTKPQPLFQRYSLKLEATVSIIQIMMEV